MRLRNAFADSLIYGLYMLGACIACMCAEIFIVKVVTLLFVIDDFTLCIIRTVIYTLGVNAILCILAYKEGYRSAVSSPLSTFIAGAMATVMHLLFALLFSFEAFSAGGVRFIVGLYKFGSRLSESSLIANLPRSEFIVIFIVNSLIYCALMAVAQAIGAKRRIIDRRDLTKDQHDDVSTANNEN